MKNNGVIYVRGHSCTHYMWSMTIHVHDLFPAKPGRSTSLSYICQHTLSHKNFIVIGKLGEKGVVIPFRLVEVQPLKIHLTPDLDALLCILLSNEHELTFMYKFVRLLEIYTVFLIQLKVSVTSTCACFRCSN